MPRSHAKMQAVVFDIDDTLYPERRFVRSGYHAVAEHLRQQTGRGDAFEDWLWERFLDGRTARAFNGLAERFQLHLDDGQIAKLVQVYRFHRPDIQPFEGIAELLGKLRERLSLGIVSDGPAGMQRNKLEALGLADQFESDAVILTDTLGPGCGKPSTAAFEILQKIFRLPHEACMYVADNPAKDFLAPNQLGWRSVWYLREGQIHAEKPAPPGGQAGLIVRNDRQLLDALAKTKS